MAAKKNKKRLSFSSIDDVKMVLEASKEAGAKLDQKEFMEALNELNLSDSDLNSLILWCQKNKISINVSDSDDDEDIEELDSDDDSLDDGEDEDSEDSETTESVDAVMDELIERAMADADSDDTVEDELTEDGE